MCAVEENMLATHVCSFYDENCHLRKRVDLNSVSLGVLVDGFMLGLGHHLDI